MICPNCKASNSDNASFCVSCGSSLNTAAIDNSSHSHDGNPHRLERQFIGVFIGMEVGVFLYNLLGNNILRLIINNEVTEFFQIAPFILSALIGGYVAGRIADRNWFIVGILSGIELFGYSRLAATQIPETSYLFMTALYIAIANGAVFGAFLGQKRFKMNDYKLSRQFLLKEKFIPLNNLTNLLIISLPFSWIFSSVETFLNYQDFRYLNEFPYSFIIKGSSLFSSLVFFSLIAWVFFAYRNLFAFSVSRSRVHPIWAACYYMVPVLNWFRPYQIFNELWEANSNANNVSANTSWKDAGISLIIKLWWSTVLLAAFIGILSFLISIYSIFVIDFIQDNASFYLFRGLFNFISFFSSIFLIFILKGINSRQESRFQLFISEMS